MLCALCVTSMRTRTQITAPSCLPSHPSPRRVFLLPNRPADCVWGAVAWANSDQSVHVQALGDVALAPFVYVHELGHTLGLEHAGKGDNVYGEAAEWGQLLLVAGACIAGAVAINDCFGHAQLPHISAAFQA